jgi:prepilin signal peptidase PulO-like enzyme (type II secretory pathway)
MMSAMIIFAILLGFVLGVVVNWLADSLPVDRHLHPIVCQECGQRRDWTAWSGLIGWITESDRCMACHHRRSWRAPVVEVAAMILSGWLFWKDPSPAVFWPGLLIGFILLLIFVIDVEHRLILHVVTGPSAIAIALVNILWVNKGVSKVLVGGIVGFVAVLLLYLFGAGFVMLVSRMRGDAIDEVAFGFGDVTLSGVLGLMVGYPGIILALFAGVMAGGAFSLVYMLGMKLRGRYDAFAAIPYGPFLIIGASLVYYGGQDLFTGMIVP